MNEASLKALGLRLRAAREAAGLSVQQLAERVGAHRAYIDRLEKGQRRPSAEWLQKIADAIGLDTGDLLTYIGVKPGNTIPSTRMFFRQKYGMSDDEAKVLANLVEHQIRERREGTHGDTEREGHERDD